MIKKLILHRFGKFSNREFPFSRTTLFFGENESGKSTIFDGLMEGLCVSDLRNTHIKAIKGRYGDDRSVDVEADPEIPAADPTEFINLCAIRAGQIDVTTKDGKSWVEKVKQGLFTGGVDPGVLVKKLEREISSNAKGTLKKQKMEAEQKYAERKETLKELQRKRSAVLEEEALVRKSSEDIQKLEKQISEKEKTLSDFEDYLKTQQNIRILRERRRMLTVLSTSEQCAREKRDLNQFARDESEKFDTRREEIEQLVRKIESERALHADYQKRVTEEKKRLDEMQAQIEGERTTARKAEIFLQRLKDKRFASVSRTKIKWKPLFLVSAAAAAAAAVLVFFLLQAPAGIAAAAAVGAASGLLVFFARYSTEETNENEIRKNIEELKEAWQIECPGSRELVGTMPGSIRDELTGLLHSYENKERQEREMSNTLRRYRQELEKIEQNISDLKSKRESEEEKLNSLLKERGVSSVKEYNRKIQDHAAVREKSERINQEIQRFCEELNVKDEAELRSRCDEDIRALEQYVGDDFESDEAVQAVRHKADDLGRHISDMRKRRNDLQQRLAKQEGALESSLGDLPNQILRLEEELEMLRQHMQDLEYDTAASKEAAEMFQEIAEDAGLGLEKLSGEVADLFAVLTGRSGRVSFPEFNIDSVEAVDAGGGARQLDHLSTGTKDTFMLASRLVLARKAGNEQKLLILDEPFHALDEDRIRRALELIDTFIKESGWQLVLFTKDTFLRSTVETQFTDCMVHEL